MKKPPTAHTLVIADFCRYLFVRPFGADGECTSLTANKNCIAHTRRQHRFSDNVNAHSANVTSYTTANSSGALAAGADILSRNSSASNARSRLTRHSSASEVSASSVAALLLLLLTVAGRGAGSPGAVPLPIFAGEVSVTGTTTGTAEAVAGCAPGLTLAEVPPTECLDESSVDTFSGKWLCGRRGMFW